MKTSIKLFALGMILMGFGVSVNAQNSASATATANATIVTPIAIQEIANMNFGNIVVNAAGSVTLAPSSTPSPVYAGVIAYATPGIITAARFDVTGTAGYNYQITIPSTALTVTNQTGSIGETMTVTDWTSTPTVGAGGTFDAAGKQTIYVGAKLNVAAGQAAGTYTSLTPFTVTVNYN